MTDLTAVPADILAEIRQRAKAEWPDDPDWQEDFITEEANGYLAFQKIDFSMAATAKDQITAEVLQYFDSWEERASQARDEVEAYAEITATVPNDIPADVLAHIKHDIAKDNDWFTTQLDNLRGAIDAYRYVCETRQKVGPIRDLLIRMEKVIGEECYNGNIQNYSSWGEWEGEGRSFRYPVTFIRDGTEEKRRSRTDDLEHEELVTGYYKFGANELSIYRALVRIIDMLKAEYGLELPDAAKGTESND